MPTRSGPKVAVEPEMYYLIRVSARYDTPLDRCSRTLLKISPAQLLWKCDLQPREIIVSCGTSFFAGKWGMETHETRDGRRYLHSVRERRATL